MGERGSFPFYRLSWQTGEGGLSPNLSKGRNGSWSPFPHLCSGPLINQCVCFPGLSTNVLDPAVPALSLRPQTLRCSNSQKLLRKSVTGFFPHRTFLPVACGTGVLIASQGWLVRTQGAGLGHQGVELGHQGAELSSRGGARSPRGGAHTESTFVTRLIILPWEPRLKAFCNFSPSLLVSKPSSLWPNSHFWPCHLLLFSACSAALPPGLGCPEGTTVWRHPVNNSLSLTFPQPPLEMSTGDSEVFWLQPAGRLLCYAE